MDLARGHGRWELHTCAHRGHVTYAPDDDAPLVIRGKALRQAIIVRALAVKRCIPLLIALVAWAVWKFHGAQGSIQAALDRDLPLLRSSGIKVDQMTAIHELERALAVDRPPSSC